MNTKIAWVIAACAACSALEAPVVRADALSAANGRYVFGQLGAMRADQYMLDTKTGRVWQLICTVPHKDEKTKKVSPSQCDQTALQAVGYETLDGKQLTNYLSPIRRCV